MSEEYEYICMHCNRADNEPAGDKCRNPPWHASHVCEPFTEGESECRWCTPREVRGWKRAIS